MAFSALRFFLGDMQQFKTIQHDAVGRSEVAHLARHLGALADFAHGDVLEVAAHEGEDVDAVVVGEALRFCCRALRHLFATAACRQQSHADFDQADVAFQRGDDACAMDGEFTAATERQTIHRSDGGHLRIFETLRDLLEFGDHVFDMRHIAGGGVERCRPIHRHPQRCI